MKREKPIKVSARGRSPAPGRALPVNPDGHKSIRVDLPRPVAAPAPAPAVVVLSDEARARLSGGSAPIVSPASTAPAPAPPVEARAKHDRLWTLVGKKGAVVFVAASEAACERWDPGCEVEEPEPEDVNELGESAGDMIREYFADRSVRAWHRVVLMVVVILATMWLTRVPSRIRREPEQVRDPDPVPAPAPVPVAAAPVAARPLRSVPALLRPAGAPSAMVRPGLGDAGLPPMPPVAS